MMNHAEWDLISAYIDGELAPGEAKRVEAHLESCAACRGETESLRGVKAYTASAPRLSLPPDFAAGLAERFAKPSWTEVLRGQWRLPSFRITAEAMAAAALLMGLWFGMTYKTAEEIPLGPLLAAHDRYAGEALLSHESLVASNFSSELAVDQGDD